MSLGRLARTVLVASLAIAAILALAAPAGAVLSGHNGRIVFVSGRGGAANNDTEAKIYLRTVLSDTGGGSASGTVTPTAGIQHRHPTWSPDRTKIAYAAGTGSPCDCDIFVLDLTTPGAMPQNITNSSNITDDRPAWSPDGTHIAYESEVSDGSNQTDVIVTEYPTGVSPLHLTSTNSEYEGKPAWSPDSQLIYYAKGNPQTLNAAGIYRKPSHGGTEEPVLDAAGVSEFQPSISPDGTKMCYTRGTGFNSTADVYVTSVSTVPTGGGTDLSDDATNGNYNCTWSPDGQLIAYVIGTFTTGDLYFERADDTGFPLDLEKTANHFDGNPDWAPDGTPVCKPHSAKTGANKTVTITIDCDDTGPQYEQTPVTENILKQPKHGKLGTIQQGDPSTVKYTPNAGFQGFDSFRLNGFDAYQFATPATITIKVGIPLNLRDLDVDPSKWKLSAGTTISFKLNRKAQVTLRFQRAKPGRKVGGKCVKPTSSNKNAPKCTRYVGAGKRPVSGKKGKNKVAFKGKVSGGKTLSPGRYRLKARAKEAAGNVSPTRTTKFRILKG